MPRSRRPCSSFLPTAPSNCTSPTSASWKTKSETPLDSSALPSGSRPRRGTHDAHVAQCHRRDRSWLCARRHMHRFLVLRDLRSRLPISLFYRERGQELKVSTNRIRWDQLSSIGRQVPSPSRWKAASARRLRLLVAQMHQGGTGPRLNVAEPGTAINWRSLYRGSAESDPRHERREPRSRLQLHLALPLERYRSRAQDAQNLPQVLAADSHPA